MNTQQQYTRHYEESTLVHASPDTVFAYADDHRNLSSHMNKSSWMMAGSKMETKTDEGKGQKVGSHIKLLGTILGLNLFLDEVIIIHEPPNHKAWQTVGKINLIVIDHYTLGFDIASQDKGSTIRVYIDYNLPKSWKTQWFGFLFAEIYAKWCVQQMIRGVREHFNEKGGKK